MGRKKELESKSKSKSKKRRSVSFEFIYRKFLEGNFTSTTKQRRA